MERVLLLYIVMLLLWFASRSVNTYQVEIIEGKKAYRVKVVFAILFALPLVYFAWTRDLSIGDSSVYMRTMNEIPTTFQGLVQYLQDYPKDPGYPILIWLMKLIGLSWRDMFLVIAVIQIGSLIYVYRKYSSDYYFSMLLFLISTDYVSWMQNGIRQFLAVTIIFSATGLILNRKYIRAILVILLASTFHKSALIMIPAIFLVQGRALNIRVMATFVVFLLIFTFISTFTDLLDILLEETQYSNVVSDFTLTNDDGTHPLRVLVYSLPVLLAILLRSRGGYTMPPIINLSVNMCLLCAGFYLVSMVSSGIFIGRIPIYFSLYNYILIPWELNKLFVKSQRKIVISSTIVLYLIFSLFQFAWGWS